MVRNFYRRSALFDLELITFFFLFFFFSLILSSERTGYTFPPLPRVLAPPPTLNKSTTKQRRNTQAHSRWPPRAATSQVRAASFRSLSLFLSLSLYRSCGNADDADGETYSNQSLTSLLFPLTYLKKNQSQPPSASAPTSRPRPRTWRWTVSSRKTRRETERVRSPSINFCFFWRAIEFRHPACSSFLVLWALFVQSPSTLVACTFHSPCTNQNRTNRAPHLPYSLLPFQKK